MYHRMFFIDIIIVSTYTIRPRIAGGLGFSFIFFLITFVTSIHYFFYNYLRYYNGSIYPQQ
ncbi:hypothetical protein EAI30_18485 [Romboutsia ilealis]|nr:hypothetical protein [Faecalicatena contorta]MRN26584.1 hypothetical protein [Romboutsia ilealis]